MWPRENIRDEFARERRHVWRSAFHSSNGVETTGWNEAGCSGRLAAAGHRNTRIRCDELRGNVPISGFHSLLSIFFRADSLPFLLLCFFFFFFLRCARRVNDIRRGRWIPNGSPRAFHFSLARSSTRYSRASPRGIAPVDGHAEKQSRIRLLYKIARTRRASGSDWQSRVGHSIRKKNIYINYHSFIGVLALHLKFSYHVQILVMVINFFFNCKLTGNSVLNYMT